MAGPTFYWEDFAAGDTRLLGPRVVTAEEIMEFARQFDPQDFHVDGEHARHSSFGGLVASGWHTCSLAMRLVCDGYLLRTASVGSPGVDKIRWKLPVRPGDALSVRTSVLETRRSASRPGTGIVRFHWDIQNQCGQSVAELETTGIFRCRSRG